MAVAALLTSASAVTTPQAAPAQAAAGLDAPQNFARLVSQTQSEARPSEEVSAEDAPATILEDTTEDLSAEQPADLLAEIQAMVVAASQLGSGQPVTAGMTAAAVLPNGETAQSAGKLTATGAATAKTLAPASTTPSPLAPTNGAAVEIPVPHGATASLQQSPELTQIAGMIAALRQAFGKEEAAKREPPAPVPLEAEAAAKTNAPSVAVAMQIPGQPPVDDEKAEHIPTDFGETEQAAADKTSSKTRLADLIEAALAKAAPATKRSEPVIIQPALVARDSDIVDSDAPTADDGPPAVTQAVAMSPPAPNTPVVTTAPAGNSAFPVQTAPSADTAGVEGHGLDHMIDRHLDLARDNQWLDRLAREISQAATNPGQMKFHLNPQNLGALTVEIASTAMGASIRMTTDTEQARTIIADAQPRLIAEVRAQGLRIADTHVDLSDQQSGSSSAGAGAGSAFAQQQQGQQHRPSEDHKPFAGTQSSVRDDAGDSASSENSERYA